MPVVGYEQQVLAAVSGAPSAAGHMPGRFQGGLAEQRRPEEDLQMAATVDIACSKQQGGRLAGDDYRCGAEHGLSG
mgnify:CR=1 FL=1